MKIKEKARYESMDFSDPFLPGIKAASRKKRIEPISRQYTFFYEITYIPAAMASIS